MPPIKVRVDAPPPPPNFRTCVEERRHAAGSVYRCNPPFTVTFDDEAGYDAFMNLTREAPHPVHVVIEKDTGEVEDLQLTEMPSWARQAMDQRLADIKAGKRGAVRDKRRQAIRDAKRQKPARKTPEGRQGESGARETLSRMLIDRLDHLEYGPCPTAKCGLPDGQPKQPQPFSLGPHQQAAVELFATDGVQRLLLAQRTGAGKTFIILGCVKRFLADHPGSTKRINIVVPTTELVKNIYESASMLFPDAEVDKKGEGFRTGGRLIHVGLYHHFARKGSGGVAWGHPKAVSREAYTRQQNRADTLKLKTQEGKPYKVRVGKTAHRNIFEGAVTLFDEAHYLTEPQELIKQGDVGTVARVLLLAEMIREASDDAKIVLLTATPASTTADLDNLMDIVVGDHGLSQGRSREEGYVCFFPEDVGAPINFAEGKWLMPGMQLPQILPVPVIRTDRELTTFAEQYLCGVSGKLNKEDAVKRRGVLSDKTGACWNQKGGKPTLDHTRDKFDSLGVLEHAGGVKTRARPRDFYGRRPAQDRRARMIVEAGDDLVPKMAAVTDYVAKTKGKTLVMAYTEHGGLALQKMLEKKGVNSQFLLGSSKKEEELKCHKGSTHNDCKAHAEVREAMALFNDPKANRYGEKLRCLVLNPPNFQEGVSFCGVETIVLFDVPPDYKALVQRVGRAIRFCSHTSFADRVTVNVVMPVLHLPKAVSIDGKPEIDLTGVVTGDEMAFANLAEQWSENLRVNCELYRLAVDREYLSSEKRLPTLKAYGARCSSSRTEPSSAPIRSPSGPLSLDPPLDQRIAEMRRCKVNLEKDLAKIKKRDTNTAVQDKNQRYLVTLEATGISRKELDVKVDRLNKAPIKVATYWMGDLESYSAGISRGSTFVIHMKRTDQAGLGDGLLRWIEKNVGGGVLDAVRKALGHDGVSLTSIEPVNGSLRSVQAGRVKGDKSREREQKAIDRYEECVYQVAGGDPPPDPEWIRRGAKGKPPVRERGGHSIPEEAEPYNCPVDTHLLHRVAKQEWDEKAVEAGWFGKLPPKPIDPCEPICTDTVLRDARKIKEDMDVLTRECLARGGTKGGCDPHDLYAGYTKDRDRRCLPRPGDKEFVPEQSAECDLHVKHRKLLGTQEERQEVSGELDELYRACVNVENPSGAGDRIRREHDRIANRQSGPAATTSAAGVPAVPRPVATETRAERAARLGKARENCAPGDALCLVTGEPELATGDGGAVARVSSKPKKARKRKTPSTRTKKK